MAKRWNSENFEDIYEVVRAQNPNYRAFDTNLASNTTDKDLVVGPKVYSDILSRTMRYEKGPESNDAIDGWYNTLFLIDRFVDSDREFYIPEGAMEMSNTDLNRFNRDEVEIYSEASSLLQENTKMLKWKDKEHGDHYAMGGDWNKLIGECQEQDLGLLTYYTPARNSEVEITTPLRQLKSEIAQDRNLEDFAKSMRMVAGEIHREEFVDSYLEVS